MDQPPLLERGFREGRATPPKSLRSSFSSRGVRVPCGKTFTPLPKIGLTGPCWRKLSLYSRTRKTLLTWDVGQDEIRDTCLKKGFTLLLSIVIHRLLHCWGTFHRITCGLCNRRFMILSLKHTTWCMPSLRSLLLLRSVSTRFLRVLSAL